MEAECSRAGSVFQWSMGKEKKENLYTHKTFTYMERTKKSRTM